MGSLVDEFLARGHQVTVITTVPHYSGNRIWPEYSGKLAYHESSGRLHVYRLYTYVAKDKANVAQRILAYATFHFLSLLRGLTIPRHDVLLVPSPPLSNGVIADFIGRLRSVPYVYNVQDIWPDVAVRAGLLKSEKAIRRLKGMESYVYRRAAHITVLSDGFQRNLRAKGVPDAKISVIPNFVDSDFVVPRPKDNSFARKHGLQNNFVVLFAGNMGFSQGLDGVLDAAQLLEHNEHIQFLMVGNGAGRISAEDYLKRKQIRNVQFLAYQPRETLPDLYGTADVCLIPLRRGFAAQSVPSKLLTIMGAGKPAIAAVDPGSEIWDLLETSKAGTCVEPENAPALADAILRFYADPEARRAAGDAGRALVEREYRPGAIADRYIEVLGNVAAGRTTNEKDSLSPAEVAPTNSDRRQS